MSKKNLPEWDYWNKYLDPKVYDWCDPVMYGYIEMNEPRDNQPVDLRYLDEDVRKLYLAKDGDLEAVIPTLKDPELRNSLLIKKQKQKYTISEQERFRWLLYHFMYYLLEVYRQWFPVDLVDITNYLEIYYYSKNKSYGVENPILSKNPESFFSFSFAIAYLQWPVPLGIPFHYKNKKRALFFKFSYIDRALSCFPMLPKFSRDVIPALNLYFLREDKSPVIWLHRYKNIRGFALDSSFWEAYLRKSREVWFFTRDFCWYSVSHSWLELYIWYYTIFCRMNTVDYYIVGLLTIPRTYAWEFILDTPLMLSYAKQIVNFIKLLSFIVIHEPYFNTDDNPDSFCRYPGLNRQLIHFTWDDSYFCFPLSALDGAGRYLGIDFNLWDLLQFSQIFDSIYNETPIHFDLYLDLPPGPESEMKNNLSTFAFSRQFIMSLDTFKFTRLLFEDYFFASALDPIFATFVHFLIKVYDLKNCDLNWAISYFDLDGHQLCHNEFGGCWHVIFDLLSLITCYHAEKHQFYKVSFHRGGYNLFTYEKFHTFENLTKIYDYLGIDCSVREFYAAIDEFNKYFGKMISMDLFLLDHRNKEDRVWGVWIAAKYFENFIFKMVWAWTTCWGRHYAYLKKQKKIARLNSH